MIERLIDDITEDDFRRLADVGATESRTLEFKRNLPGGGDADRKEFLNDITSLANANGGDLLFGVAEGASGAVEAIPGLDPQLAEAEVLRLENILRDGVEPRLPPVKIRRILMADGREVLMFRVPASLMAPHRVILKNSGRFFTRNSRGKYEMDTFELRQAFTSAEQLPVRLRALHEQATSDAYVGFPFRLRDAPNAIASLIPLRLLRESRQVGVTPETALAPYAPRIHHKVLQTLEGVVLYSDIDKPDPGVADNWQFTPAFARTYWQGRIDVGWNLGGVRRLNSMETEPMVFPKAFEDGLTDMFVSGVAKLQGLGVEGPWVVMVTVMGISGHVLSLGDGYTSTQAWRQGASLPELVLDHARRDALLPIFRSFWLLFGEVRPDDFGAQR